MLYAAHEPDDPTTSAVRPHGEVFEEDLVVVRPNRLLILLASLPALGPLIVAAFGSPVAALHITFHALLLSLIGLTFIARRNPSPRQFPTRARAHDGALRLDSRHFYPRGELRDGLLVPRPAGRPHVTFKRRGLAPRVEVEVADTHQGRRLLRALGFDASQTIADFRLAPALLVYPRLLGGGLGAIAALFAIVIAISGDASHVGPFFIVSFTLAIALCALVKHKLQVGTDGLLLGWLWTRRFIPHCRIAQVSEYDEGLGGKTYTGVDLVLDGGEKVRMVVGQKGWSNADAAAIAERIREAKEMQGRRGAEEASTGLLMRGSRGMKEWISSLRGIGAGANASLRVAPIQPERLWRIVEDPGADGATRAGAAVALGPELDDDGRARLRVVAQGVAAPRLRVAIERVARADPDDAIEDALAHVDGAVSRSAQSE